MGNTKILVKYKIVDINTFSNFCAKHKRGELKGLDLCPYSKQTYHDPVSGIEKFSCTLFPDNSSSYGHIIGSTWEKSGKRTDECLKAEKEYKKYWKTNFKKSLKKGRSRH